MTELVFEQPIAPHTPEIDTQGDVVVSLVSSRLERLEREGLVTLESGETEIPDWWFDQEQLDTIRAFESEIKTGDRAPFEISDYFQLYEKEQEIREGLGLYSVQGPIGQFIYNFGEQVVGDALANEDAEGPLHKAILKYLEEDNSKEYGDVLTKELQALRHAYGLENMTQLLGIGGDDFSEKVREQVLTKNGIKWIRYNEEYRGDKDEILTWKETQEACRVWMSKALESATGLDQESASNYVFSASRKGSGDAILDIIHKFDHFGVERIKKLSLATGIHGLEAYNIDQLELMEEFANDSDGLVNRLVDHDVNIVMVNRFGDHNGVMESAAEEFDDSAKRTLFFEITTMDDIYRSMAKLNRSGIKPSTVVLAAHSAPGQFMVSDDRDPGMKRTDVATIAGRKFVELAKTQEELDKGLRGYSMHGMKGLSRLVDDYMQPSRAIDDGDMDKGRKKIIFQACNAGTEVKMGDKTSSGEIVEIGFDSVVGRLGADLIHSGVSSNIDIYGAPGGIQMHRTESGVRYSGQPEEADEVGNLVRSELHAVRVRVDSQKLDKSVVDEIVLRK